MACSLCLQRGWRGLAPAWPLPPRGRRQRWMQLQRLRTAGMPSPGLPFGWHPTPGTGRLRPVSVWDLVGVGVEAPSVQIPQVAGAAVLPC